MLMTELLAFAIIGNVLDVHVSPGGSDTAGGTVGSPVATLEQARAIAASHPGPATVHLSAGAYQLQQTLVLGPEDSGVHWTADDNEATISGGVELGNWTVSKVKSATGAAVLQADVSTVIGRQDRHLYIQGQRAKRSRLQEAAALALFAGHGTNEAGFSLPGKVPLPWPAGIL